MNYKLTKSNQIFIYASLALLLFVFEFVTTFVINFSDYDSVRLVGFYKIFFLLIILINTSFLKINKIFFVLITGLTITYLINQFLLQNFDYTNLKESLSSGALYYLVRYIYIFVFIIAFLTFKNKDKIINKAIIWIEFLLFVNSILIILGIIFDIGFFKSYPNGIRFGYDGLFNKVNEVSYFYCIYISHLYYRYIRKKKGVLLLLFIITSSIIIGTKAVLLFLGLLFSYHILFVVKRKKQYRFIFIPIIVVFAVVLEPIMMSFLGSSPQWGELMQKHGLITVLTSTRDLLFYKGIAYINDAWSFLNWFFGGPFYNKNFKNTEIGFLDFFIFLGFLGSLIYSLLFYKCFIKNRDAKIIVLFSLIMIVALLAGGLFLSTASLVYIYFISCKYDLKVLNK